MHFSGEVFFYPTCVDQAGRAFLVNEVMEHVTNQVERTVRFHEMPMRLISIAWNAVTHSVRTRKG